MKYSVRRTVQILFLLLIPLSHRAAAEEFSDILKFSIFVDTYYAYDFNAPANFDRAFTTQPARSDEFNVNLAYVDAVIKKNRTRGRLALQAGTSVQSNYASEPTIGTVSGSSLSRNIQEAYVGYQINKAFWIDAGIYFSHAGGESFISKDDLTYTRSMVADFSPYYQSGVRLSYQTESPWGFQLHIVNGWQNISENNHSKTLGTQISYSWNNQTTLSYNTLIGYESAFRQFHDFVFKYGINDLWTLNIQADIGLQNKYEGSGQNTWWGTSFILRRKIDFDSALTGRIENYSDPEQVIVNTATEHGLQAISASLGYDLQLDTFLAWRTEFRQYWSKDDIYPTRTGLSNQDSLVVTSLALSL